MLPDNLLLELILLKKGQQMAQSQIWMVTFL